MSQKPIFVLGLGIQKCGTTWLHRHLCEHPSSQLSANFNKELNLASNGYRRAEPIWRRPRAWWLKRQCFIIHGLHWASGEKGDFHRPMLGMDRLQLNRDFAASGAHNVLFLRHAQQGFVGDVSPDYAVAAEADLRALRHELEMDFDLRTFVIWRDPVNRLESALRHTQRDGLKNGEASLLHFAATGELRSWAWNSNYERAVGRLDAVFPEAMHLVYEELFGPSGQTQLDLLHNHLGIASIPGIFGQAFNAAEPGQQALSPELRASAREHLDRQYEVMAERLGRARLASIWNF